MCVCCEKDSYDVRGPKRRISSKSPFKVCLSISQRNSGSICGCTSSICTQAPGRTLSNSFVIQLCVMLLSVMLQSVWADGNGGVGSPANVGNGGYVEIPCCSHQFRRKEHVQEFSCGRLFYRTFHLEENRDTLYVGAMDLMFRVNLNNITQTDCERDSMRLDPTNLSKCLFSGKSENFECRNHIRVIQPMSNDRLFVCGTNAYNPKDWVIYGNLTHLQSQDYVPGIGSGVGGCPFDPNDNNTAVWVEEGNPGGLAGLYSGIVTEFTRADTVIFRGDLYNHTTKRREYIFQRTIKDNSMWLDKPNFVGSYDVGEYVFFFFRETAVEYINCGKNIYSRVARICKKDTGGKNLLTQNWTTYLKARLNCSIPGEFPFYFNVIQSVYKIPGDDSKFYAVFTTSMNGFMGSAICTFTFDDIQKAFMGRFKEQATSSSAWLPVFTSKVPEPRPGQCVNESQTLPACSLFRFLLSRGVVGRLLEDIHLSRVDLPDCLIIGLSAFPSSGKPSR